MKGEHHAITLRFLAQPTDVNFGGKVHGGAAMKWIDQAGYACATGWSGAYCVTIYVGGIRFFKPILIGNVVEVRASVIHTGKTSMHIAVDVFAADPKTLEFVQCTHCIIIFVAVDELNNPIAVPKWTPTTTEQIDLEQYAIRLIELRKAIDTEMQSYRL